MSGPKRSSVQADSAAFADETIAAIATAPGRGAIAIVRVSGPRAFAIASQCLVPWPLAARAVALVRVQTPDGADVDQALAASYPAPHSFTGEDVLEIFCHGGAVAPARVLAAIVRAGARPALPGEFTRRAVLGGKLELLQAEALGDLIDAPTGFLHRAALAQLSGALTERISRVRSATIDLEALLAYDVDFPEEDDGPVARSRIADGARTVLDELDRLLSTLPAARIGREGAVIVLAGVPNAGKSSLFNAVLGESRAIVSEHPGTTRDAIDALIEAVPYPWRLVDTAGLRDATDPVERLGVEVSTRWLARADVALACGRTKSERDAAVAGIAGLSDATVLRVQTMGDLAPAAADADAHVSAVTGDGLAALRAAVGNALEARHPLPTDTPLVLRTRHEAALAAARSELSEFLAAWDRSSVPATVAAVHVRAAVHALDELIGAVDADDVLARVFEKFCVGK